jgi:glycosyltransferase involved in cell wall biosynthesis
MFRGRVVAVVIPACNEADKIAATVRSVPDFVDHVIVVDDGSHDATAAIARAASDPLSPAASDPLSPRSGSVDERVWVRGRVEVIVHPQNRGVGAAITTGYARALELGAYATAVMAGDGQMDPADLPRLLGPVVDGDADYAKGNRFAWRGGWRSMPAVRLIGGGLLSWFTRLASGYWRVGDSQCGYTVASRRAVEAIGSDLFPRYGYPNDLLTKLGASRARVVDVPVRPVYGPSWRSGLRPSRVALPIAGLLARGFVRRMRARWRAEPRGEAAPIRADDPTGAAT